MLPLLFLFINLNFAPQEVYLILPLLAFFSAIFGMIDAKVNKKKGFKLALFMTIFLGVVFLILIAYVIIGLLFLNHFNTYQL